MAKTRLGFDLGSSSMKVALLRDNSLVRLEKVRLPENLVDERGTIALPHMFTQFLKQTKKELSLPSAAELESFGTAHGLAVWDLNSIAGGKAAVTNWQGAGMMRPDRIHFTPAGYQLHGKMLGEAI